MYLTMLAPFMFADDSKKELRIDVALAPDEVEKELGLLHERLNRPSDALYRLPPLCINYPGLVFRYRVADGEHYIYVEDVRRRRLAGYTVLNRLIELDRRGDRVLRAPHSRYAADYQRRGIATAIYRWWLDSGNCLISGARQSAGANALWESLGASYGLIHVDLRKKKLSYLGRSVSPRVLEDLHTRMIMLGRNWSVQGLALTAGMHGADTDDKIVRSLQDPATDQHRKRI